MSNCLNPFTPYELSVTDEIDSIIEPLKNCFDINYFSATKIFANLKGYSLCNHKAWLDYYTANDLHQYYDSSPLPLGKKFFFLEDIDKESAFYQRIVSPMITEFDFTQLVSYVVYHIGCICIYSFGVPSHVNNFMRTVLENQDYIKQFTYYFSEKAQPIMKKAYKHAKKIRLIPTIKDKIKEHIINENENADSEQSTIPLPKRFYLDGSYQEKYLTRQEFRTLSYLCKGYTLSNIAQFLEISFKTVQEYISNVKLKLNMASKDELLKYVMEYDIIPQKFDSFDLKNQKLIDSRRGHLLTLFKQSSPEMYELIKQSDKYYTEIDYG